MKLSSSTLALARLVAGESRTMIKFPGCVAIAMLLGLTNEAAQDFGAAMAAK